MSKITIALEAAVATVIANSPKDVRPTARQRANVDRAFADILKLIAPRIRHFIRQYGLVAHWDDAEQCCAIAVHRAIEAYDPAKAQFTTFVNWQLRGELQSLRFRLMIDQRPSAKKVEATTVSLHALSIGAEGEEASLESMIEDENALSLTESAASDHLAGDLRSALIGRYVDHLRQVGMDQLKRAARAKRPAAVAHDPSRPRFKAKNDGVDPADIAEMEAKLAEHVHLVERRIFDDTCLDDLEQEFGIAKERLRQTAKRAAKTIADLAAAEPHFASDLGRKLPQRRRTTRVPAQPTVTIVPDAHAAHNQLTTVVAITPETMENVGDGIEAGLVQACPALISETLN
ncbi:RNA polymerase subunit sigma-70 [Sphingomonas sp. CCH5-D11]|uniref:RNA polymerase subunit sigma-70 n=1 Tax=Sphingomonas sp. CCH5-D11 TaxID=1768786 RepID=UPI000835A996|nr:RNA polymerase subunit sigma-70 [Sphingomonas sp. CCH5-D11]